MELGQLYCKTKESNGWDSIRKKEKCNNYVAFKLITIGIIIIYLSILIHRNLAYFDYKQL